VLVPGTGGDVLTITATADHHRREARPAPASGGRSGPARPQESRRPVPQAEARHKGKAGLRESPRKPVTKRGRSVHAPWTRAGRVPHRGPPGVACRGDTGPLLVKGYFST